jgi:hypothetical protein
MLRFLASGDSYVRLQHLFKISKQVISCIVPEVCEALVEKLKDYIQVRQSKKAVPLQPWSGPEGSRKLRFPDFLTTAQDGGKVVSLTYRPHLPQEIHLVLISVRG